VRLVLLSGLLALFIGAVAGGAVWGPVGAFFVLVAGGLSILSLLSLGGAGGSAIASLRLPTGEAAFLAGVFAGAFAVRAASSVALHATGWWEYLGGDEQTFDSNGQVFARWLAGDSPYMLRSRFLGSHEVGYFYLVGSAYYVFGVTKAVPLFLTCVVGAATVYPVHALAAHLGGRVAARRAAHLVAWFPSLVLWSSLMVRDSMVLFFLAAALLAAYHLRRRFSVPRLAALLVCLAAVATLRTYIFLLVSVSLAASLVLGQRNVFRALATGGLLMLAVVAAFQSTGVGTSEMERANLEFLHRQRVLNAMGTTIAGSMGTDVDISTPTAALTYLPVGLAYFYFSPFPWQIGSPRQVLALVDLLVWYSILPSVFAGFASLVRRRLRAILPLLLVVIGISVLYALVEGNIGIIFRHRAQIIVPLCAVAGVGLAMRRRAARKESRRLEGLVPLDAAARGALGPPAGLRLPAGAR